jgi:hypothetical protein
MSVTFRLGLVVLHKRFIRTTIGTVFVHTVILPSCLLSHCCHVMCPVMCRSCVALCSSVTFLLNVCPTWTRGVALVDLDDIVCHDVQ